MQLIVYLLSQKNKSISLKISILAIVALIGDFPLFETYNNFISKK